MRLMNLMPFRCEFGLITAVQHRESTHGLSRSPASGPDRSGTGVVANFYLPFQERHGHEDLLVGIVPKYYALPFLVEETFDRRVDLAMDEVGDCYTENCRARVALEKRFPKAACPACFRLSDVDCRESLKCGGMMVTSI